MMAWRRTGKSMIQTNDGLVYWRIYTSLGFEELRLSIDFAWYA